MTRFLVEPHDYWQKHYEKKMLEFMAMLMRKQGLTQIELLPRDLLRADDTVDRVERPDGGTFYRIRGEFQV